MPRILVIDDEKAMVKGLKFNLESEGYQVDVGYDGETAVEMARSQDYDIIMLDLMMPKIDGLSACMQIREFSTVPIIMLTARSEDTDKLLGFSYGADDYITKPFNILEVKARVKALLRRAGSREKREEKKEIFTLGQLNISRAARQLRRRGEVVDLTAREFDLFVFLAANPGRVYSREDLLNLVWGYDYMGDVRTVDVHIRRLREKVEDDPAHPRYLRTKWGVGYYCAENTEVAE